MNPVKKRNYPLDLIRVMACLMVVLMHSPMPSEKASGLFLGLLSYATAPCIGLFFMVSGALLLPVKEETGILYYCTGYVGYFLLGHYLNKYPEAVSWRFLLPAVFMALLAPVFCKWKQYEVDFYSLFWYLSIFVVILCTAWFKGLSQYGKLILEQEKIQIGITWVSNLSFGIYLMHIFVMRYMIWRWTWIQNMDNYIGQTLLIVVLTFLLSVLGCYLLSWIPGAAYLIGYKQKK